MNITHAQDGHHKLVWKDRAISAEQKLEKVEEFCKKVVDRENGFEWTTEDAAVDVITELLQYYK